ncbi:MAG: 50S ribosomal protein L22 [Planctomycetes bacterium]|nr:50S ribosomal protein L22 [Planctomycetota bacterium]
MARATHRFASITARKARLVADLVRGKGLPEAYVLLAGTRKRATRMVTRLLRSAQHNAEQADPTVDVDTLYVRRIFVDNGPTMKRMGMGYRGRPFPILKRMSHLTVDVAPRATALGAAGEE